jgi:hypothetical protein
MLSIGQFERLIVKVLIRNNRKDKRLNCRSRLDVYKKTAFSAFETDVAGNNAGRLSVQETRQNVVYGWVFPAF